LPQSTWEARIQLLLKSFLRFCAVSSWCGKGRTSWILRSKATFVPLSASTLMAAAMSAWRARFMAPTRVTAAMAVMACVPLMRASPSLG